MAVLFGPVDEVPDVLYQQINAEMTVKEAALRTKGSGVDASGCLRESPLRNQARTFVILLPC